MSIKQASVWYFRLTVLYNIFNLFSIKLFLVYNCFYVKKIKNKFYKLKKKYFNIFLKKPLEKITSSIIILKLDLVWQVNPKTKTKLD
jgi:hypothetical protein